MLKDPRYAGMLKELADELGVSKASVSEAWHRPRKSKRIRQAIEREIARRDECAAAEAREVEPAQVGR